MTKDFLRLLRVCILVATAMPLVIWLCLLLGSPDPNAALSPQRLGALGLGSVLVVLLNLLAGRWMSRRAELLDQLGREQVDVLEQISGRRADLAIFASAATNRDRRGLHDLVARTVVSTVE